MPIQISLVVLSYNGGDSLLRTLESCKLQTYPYKDLVIADDASTDNGYTVSVIEKWLTENSKFFTNVLFIKNTSNMGIVENKRNASLQAKGEILFGLGQGDLTFASDTLEHIAIDVQKYKAASDDGNIPLIWLSQFRAFSLKPNWHEVFMGASLPYQLELVRKYPNFALRILLSTGNFICGASFIYSTKFYDPKIYPLDNISNIEDYPALLYMLLTEKKIGFFDFSTRWYEYGTGVSTSKASSNMIKMQRSFKEIEDWLILLSKTLPLSHQKLIFKLIKYRHAPVILKFLLFPATFILHVAFRLTTRLALLQTKLNRFRLFYKQVE